jgi:ankyrin repeat protein
MWMFPACCVSDRGAGVNAMNSCGTTALHDAVLKGDKDIVEELLHNGANPLIQAMKGFISVV